MTDIVLWVASQLVVGAAIYGGIRADIKWLHEEVSRAHTRIDQLLNARSHHA